MPKKFTHHETTLFCDHIIVSYMYNRIVVAGSWKNMQVYLKIKHAKREIFVAYICNHHSNATHQNAIPLQNTCTIFQVSLSIMILFWFDISKLMIWHFSKCISIFSPCTQYMVIWKYLKIIKSGCVRGGRGHKNH